ncbi:unnamed protein product, partial [Discosporangium mesarthrocarpum]
EPVAVLESLEEEVISSTHHIVPALICTDPRCRALEFPGCGQHGMLLVVSRPNGHMGCPRCSTSTDTSYPWVLGCRSCRRSGATQLTRIFFAMPVNEMKFLLRGFPSRARTSDDSTCQTDILSCRTCGATAFPGIGGSQSSLGIHAPPRGRKKEGSGAAPASMVGRHPVTSSALIFASSGEEIDVAMLEQAMHHLEGCPAAAHAQGGEAVGGYKDGSGARRTGDDRAWTKTTLHRLSITVSFSEAKYLNRAGPSTVAKEPKLSAARFLRRRRLCEHEGEGLLSEGCPVAVGRATGVIHTLDGMLLGTFLGRDGGLAGGEVTQTGVRPSGRGVWMGQRRAALSNLSPSLGSVRAPPIPTIRIRTVNAESGLVLSHTVEVSATRAMVALRGCRLSWLGEGAWSRRSGGGHGVEGGREREKEGLGEESMNKLISERLAEAEDTLSRFMARGALASVLFNLPLPPPRAMRIALEAVESATPLIQLLKVQFAAEQEQSQNVSSGAALNINSVVRGEVGPDQALRAPIETGGFAGAEMGRWRTAWLGNTGILYELVRSFIGEEMGCA